MFDGERYGTVYESEEYDNEPDYDRDKYQSYLWAHELTSGSYEDWVVLDTETTGLEDDAQIVDICVLSKYGTPLLDTLVKPSIPIPKTATRIHGITNEMVENAPTWKELYWDIWKAIAGKIIVIYNANFDLARLRFMCDSIDEAHFPTNYCCAMNKYAQYYGDWNEYWGNYKWQKLPNAGHRAFCDAIATYNLIHKMATPLKCDVEYTGDLFPPVQLGCTWKLWGEIRAHKIVDNAYHKQLLRIPISYPKFHYLHRNLRCVEVWPPND